MKEYHPSLTRFFTTIPTTIFLGMVLCFLAIDLPALAGPIQTAEVRTEPVESGQKPVGNPEKRLLQIHPLGGLNRGSPRATFRSFLYSMNEAYSALREYGPRSHASMEWINRAITCLNMEKIPPTRVNHLGAELAIQLKEVLDRIEIPPLEQIPGAGEAKRDDILYWAVPHTKIYLTRIEEGPHKNEFLFSSETVESIPRFYKSVSHLPCKPGASEDFYMDYIYAPGWMIPHQWILMLPDWADIAFLEQTLWQWFGLMVLLTAGGLVLLFLYRWSRARAKTVDDSRSRWHFSKLLFPAGGIVVSYLVFYFADDQINISGDVLAFVGFGLKLVFAGFAGFTIVMVGNVLIEAILASPRFQARSIDANLIRLSLRVLTLVALFVLLWNVADYFGLPVNAIFASAGVMGLAVAFAARETIANLFGGLTLLLDRPFKAGDYIVLNTGERGEVKEIGLRSTRIQTRDDITICIPNSVITNGKIVNESAPSPFFRVRIKVGVAYGSDIAQVEKALFDLATKNPLVSSYPEPRVRFRSFGDSALDFELLCWAKQPQDKGRLVHQLNGEIYHTFDELGISIPFPQRDVHVKSAAEIAS